jgi:OmpA-OmpF porin, OOP family
MTKSFTKKTSGFGLILCLGLSIASSVVNAENNLIERKYVTDEWQNVFTNDYGECWHTGTALPLLENSVPCKKSFAAFEVPVVAVTAPVPEVLVVTFSVDTMFDFDKAELRPTARTELDTFISKLSDMKPESVTVIGHTDRLGANEYNQDLSEQRSQAVKNYLVNMGVPVDNIRAYGMGEAQPVTKAGDCNYAKTDQLIVCLQPDRRVEVQVVGSKNEKAI